MVVNIQCYSFQLLKTTNKLIGVVATCNNACRQSQWCDIHQSDNADEISDLELEADNDLVGDD